MEPSTSSQGPRHVLAGIALGSQEFVGHTAGGVLALVQSPVRNFETQGPLGIVTGVAQGALDLVEGFVSGVSRFMTNTVEGVRNTPDTLTDAALVQRDEEGNLISRKRYRHVVENREGRILETHLKPGRQKHFIEGVVNGGSAFGHSMLDGVEGMIHLSANGLDGEDDNPLWGFAKGTALGVTGFAAKGTAGTLDLASAVLEGAGSTPGWIRSNASLMFSDLSEEFRGAVAAHDHSAHSAHSAHGAHGGLGSVSHGSRYNQAYVWNPQCAGQGRQGAMCNSPRAYAQQSPPGVPYNYQGACMQQGPPGVPWNHPGAYAQGGFSIDPSFYFPYGPQPPMYGPALSAEHSAQLQGPRGTPGAYQASVAAPRGYGYGAAMYGYPQSCQPLPQY